MIASRIGAHGRARRGATVLAFVLASVASPTLGQTPGASPAADEKEGLVGTPEVEAIGRLVVTSRIGGHFTNPACGEGETMSPAPIARTLEWIRRDAQVEGMPLLYDTGSLLAPHGVNRFAATEAPQTLARMVEALGYKALAFGHAELGAPREGMIATVAALRERLIPAIATNLYCSGAGERLCDVLVSGADGVSIRRVGEERVAFVGLLDPSVLERISPERAEGLRLAPVKESLDAAVRKARQLGATVVVASVEDGSEEQASGELLELAKDLPERGKPDLLLGAGAGDQFLFARPLEFRPPLAAAPKGGAARIRLRRNLLVDTFDVLVRPVPRADTAHPAVRSFIERIGDDYCQQWGGNLAGGTTEETMPSQGMLELAAGSARTAAEAELALLPRWILDPAWRPASPRGLTASDVFVALRQDEPLMVARVKGSWLTKVAKDASKLELVAPGLAVDGSNVEAHGRAIEARAEYRVVTVRPALVGPHALPSGPDWRPLEEATLRQALMAYLEEPREEDPREDLPDPARTPEWMFRTELRTSFSGTTVNNPEREGAKLYEETQLQRASTATYGLEGTVRADATAKHWGWDNILDSRYRITTAVGAAAAEGVDITSLRSTMRYRGWYERRKRFYMPEPFLQLYVETELTVPEDRPFRHFLVRPTGGVQFTLTKHLTFKPLAGFEVEMFDPDGRIQPGVGAQVVLKPWSMLETGSRKVTLEGAADYFLSDLGGIDAHTLRGNFKARYELNATLAFGWDLELFLVREAGKPPGISAVNSAFLQIGWVGRAFNP
ncbi:MAG: hypothetical protein ACOCXM_09060 [Myxococcota bacterium]